MSRPRFMPLAVSAAPARRSARSAPVPAPAVTRPRAFRPDLRTARRARRSTAGASSGPTGILCLGLSMTLENGRAHRLVDAVLDRVSGSALTVGTVVLDLRADADPDADSRAALLSLHRKLASMGTRLRIATASRPLASRLREAGFPQQLGPDAIHDSVRSAVLATYAALPGPGLVTAQVRAALDNPVEAVDS
jgi:MFS superfamily sulfate permease-like transporter